MGNQNHDPDAVRREGMRQDIVAMADRADNAVEFHLNFQVAFVPQAQWATGRYEDRRNEFRNFAVECREFAKELGR
jgi:hypothetical protein